MTSNYQEFPQTNPHLLRLSIGPSPWAFANRSITVAGVEYQFNQFNQADSKTAGLIKLQNSNNEVLLILNFYCYVRILEDGTTLLWRENGNIIFDCFQLSSLRQVSDPLKTAIYVHENKLGVSPIPDSHHWEIFPRLEPSKSVSIDAPKDWSRFEETLILANYADVNNYDKMARAIYAFDWQKQQVEVLPQDWFNHGSYDFDYQWITRVARQSDGKIVGDGIRLGSFELDDSNRQIKKWTSKNPFHMIK